MLGMEMKMIRLVSFVSFKMAASITPSPCMMYVEF
jgi:hypothetical protein